MSSVNPESFVADCILCEMCGRTHFSTVNPDFWEDGELDELIENCKNHPDKFFQEDNYDCISCGFVDGKQAVDNCSCRTN